MQRMGLQAIYPKPRTSIAAKGHKVYPYLLRNLAITRPNQVWSTDITYIRMLRGFMYLVAIIDWYSRYVVAWQLSNTLDGRFCLDTLDLALAQGKPDIFNTDQGAQFTALDFTARLEEAGIRISMDGRGRALDNVFVERLWRTVKYEHVTYTGIHWFLRWKRAYTSTLHSITKSICIRACPTRRPQKYTLHKCLLLEFDIKVSFLLVIS